MAESNSRQDKARKVLAELGVKRQVFRPSGRDVWTVVGREGDFLVDVDPIGKRKDYCSCGDYHFRVLSGTVPECYHLIAIKEAQAQGKYLTVEFSDEEFRPFLKSLIRDVFSHIT